MMAFFAIIGVVTVILFVKSLLDDKQSNSIPNKKYVANKLTQPSNNQVLRAATKEESELYKKAALIVLADRVECHIDQLEYSIQRDIIIYYNKQEIKSGFELSNNYYDNLIAELNEKMVETAGTLSKALDQKTQTLEF